MVARRRIDVSLTTTDVGYSPLHCAACGGHADVVRALLGIGGGSDIQLQQVRSFVVGQRNQGLAPHIRCARLVSKLVPLLGIEAMTLATAAVVSIGRSQLERMVLDNLLPKLSQEQRYQAQALIAGGAGGLSHALRYAGGCVPLDMVSKEICDVVDFILTARNATAANA